MSEQQTQNDPTPDEAPSDVDVTQPAEAVTEEPREAAEAAPEEPSEAIEVVPEEPTWTRFQVDEQTSEALAAAQAAIAEGECIVLPTDTVYGIGSNAFSAEAVQKLLDAKERGRDMPPPVLIAETGMFEALGDDIPSHAMRLAQAYWPGALTLIVKVQSHLRIDLGETRGTIAVRVPDHDFTRDLLRRTGPLAVSSANVSGQPSSTNIDDAVDQLGNRVKVYLDAGATPGETPSTIIDFVSSTLGRVVRQGALSLEQVHEVAPFVEGVPEPEQPEPVEQSESQEEATRLDESAGADQVEPSQADAMPTVAITEGASHDAPADPAGPEQSSTSDVDA